jgi:hypothetical protein
VNATKLLKNPEIASALNASVVSLVGAHAQFIHIMFSEAECDASHLNPTKKHES